MPQNKPQRSVDEREQSYKAAKLIRAGSRELERQLNTKRAQKTR